jgi:hypothetical protein
MGYKVRIRHISTDLRNEVLSFSRAQIKKWREIPKILKIVIEAHPRHPERDDIERALESGKWEVLRGEAYVDLQSGELHGAGRYKIKPRAIYRIVDNIELLDAGTIIGRLKNLLKK